jgi:hypothetical protein
MNEELINRLEKIFENVNSWLLFAEAKHAVLIGIIMMFISTLKDIIDIKNFKIVLVILTLSLSVSLFSFFPLIKNIPIFKIINNKNENNLCFYTDIINFKNEKDYLCAMQLKYFSNIDLDKILENNYIIDISEEIIINSKICYNKYILFRWSLFFFIIAIIYLLLKICNVSVTI